VAVTDDDKALMETIKDAVLHGTGFMKNGKHVPIDDVYLDPRDARIEALSAENERLREALGWFLNDSRFIVQVGGNPNVVPQMIEAARAALGETK
jgi:hypothetical protein